ncbi:MAG: hypothetical protein M1498_02340 [Candidatus Thermoplasmatota archaeon]|nr:hypothetical protein [Candidatus Thermoplasmatota archaeon]
MYRVYALNKNERGVIEKILSDDTMGRQTIIEKDGANMGYEGKIILVVEGQSEIFKRLDELMGNSQKPLSEKDAGAVYKKIKDEEEAAQGGVGFLFG